MCCSLKQAMFFIRNLIKNIGKEKTVMLSTHIMQEVEAVCGRVIIIDNGRIVANKSTSDMHINESNKQVINVEFDVPVSKSSLKTINGVIEVNNIKENKWEIIANNDKDIRTDIFQFAVKNKFSVISMNKEEQTLEQVFQKLTKK